MGRVQSITLIVSYDMTEHGCLFRLSHLPRWFSLSLWLLRRANRASIATCAFFRMKLHHSKFFWSVCWFAACAAVFGAEATTHERLTLPLVSDWKFHKGTVEGADAPNFADASWEAVTLPHTWNVEDGANGGGYFRGDGWYRRQFEVPREWSGKRVFIQFDGANRTAEVFLNGERLGLHRGGYSRFRYDITPILKSAEKNVLAVRVSNAANDNMIPVSGDYTFFGGLYRAVSLIATEPVHIDLLDHASPGVFVEQTNVTPARAELQVRVRLVNDSETPVDAQVNTVISDATGKSVLTVQRSVQLGALERREIKVPAVLLKPHLWDGQADPYLYRINTYVQTPPTGIDSVSLPLGVRTYTVDRERGLLLNGHYLDLHGVNRHQERDGKGWAVSEADEDEDMAIIEEMGCTFVRQSHYQQSQHWQDLGDRRGMIMWAEVAFGNEVKDNPEFFENAKEQLRELIRQNLHHPAIFFWSIGNETFIRDKKLMPPDSNDRLLRALAAVAREEDPSRLSTYASNGDATEPRAGVADVIGFNHYFGWYHGALQEFATWLDLQHENRPDLRIGMSEYGAGANVAQHDDPTHQPVAKSQFHPEEWQATFHEAYWQTLEKRPWVWCKVIWVMFDFASDGRNEGGTPGRNDKGLVTTDRKTRKDAYYWYQANWSTHPVLHLTSKRFTARTQPSTPVKVYSNLDTVELRVNGTSLGQKTSTNHIFVWPEVNLNPGNNEIEVRGNKDGRDLVDHGTWTYTK